MKHNIVLFVGDIFLPILLYVKKVEKSINAVVKLLRGLSIFNLNRWWYEKTHLYLPIEETEILSGKFFLD